MKSIREVKNVRDSEAASFSTALTLSELISGVEILSNFKLLPLISSSIKIEGNENEACIFLDLSYFLFSHLLHYRSLSTVEFTLIKFRH